MTVSQDWYDAAELLSRVTRSFSKADLVVADFEFRCLNHSITARGGPLGLPGSVSRVTCQMIIDLNIKLSNINYL